MHYSINPHGIKTGIQKVDHTVTDICNIKHYRTNPPLSMFFEDLKPAPNKKGHIQCITYTTVPNRIQTSQTQKGYCSMCKQSSIWAHQKLLTSQTEMHEMCK
jgi:hypothetical protein